MEMEDFKQDSSPSNISGMSAAVRSIPSHSGNLPDSLSQAGYGSIIHDIQSFPSNSISIHAKIGKLSSSHISEGNDDSHSRSSEADDKPISKHASGQAKANEICSKLISIEEEMEGTPSRIRESSEQSLNVPINPEQ